MERNSRDFVTRIDRINSNAEAICEVLQSHPRGNNDSWFLVSDTVVANC
jgi:cystathionine gamma-synthase